MFFPEFCQESHRFRPFIFQNHELLHSLNPSLSLNYVICPYLCVLFGRQRPCFGVRSGAVDRQPILGDVGHMKEVNTQTAPFILSAKCAVDELLLQVGLGTQIHSSRANSSSLCIHPPVCALSRCAPLVLCRRARRLTESPRPRVREAGGSPTQVR